MPKLIIHTTDEAVLKGRKNIRALLRELAGAQREDTTFLTATGPNNFEYSYPRRIEAMATAAHSVALQLKPAEGTNPILDAKLALFEVYIDKTKENYINKVKESLKDKNKKNHFKNCQKAYVEYLKHLEFILSDQVLPFAQKEIEHSPKVRKKLAGRLLAAADTYELLTKERPALATVTAKGDDKYLIQMEVPLAPISDEIAKEYRRATSDEKQHPAWYEKMPASEKLFFDAAMQGINAESDLEAVKERIKSISSRLRSIPGVANFSKHIMMIVDKHGKPIHEPNPRYRSSMVSSRDIMKLKFANKADRHQFQVEFTKANIKRTILEFLQQKYGKDLSKVSKAELESIPMLIQTLISPMRVGIYKREPDFSLFNDKQQAIKELNAKGIEIPGIEGSIKFNIIGTNHPLNPARHIVGTGTLLEYKGSENREAVEKIIALGLAVDSNPDVADELKPAIQEAAADLQKLLDTRIYGLDRNHRELHLAALEEFIVTRLGGMSDGSCVSGKDRKGTETLYADAMEQYYFEMGELPKFDASRDSKERTRFVKIFVDIYISYHQQLNAGQNADGSEGIKTLDNYLPKDIVDEIKKRLDNKNIFKESSKIGDNNDPSRVLKKAKKNLKDKQKYAALQEFNSPLGTPVLDAHLIPRETFEDSIKALKDLVDYIQVQGKFSKNSTLITRLEQRVRLLEAIPAHTPIKSQLRNFELALKTMPSKFSEKLRKISGMPGLDAGSALDQFKKLSEETLSHIHARKEMSVIPLQIKYEDIPLERLPTESNDQDAIKRIVLKKTGEINANISGEELAIVSGQTRLGQDAAKLMEGQVRVSTIEVLGELPIILADTVKGGRGKSTVYQLPDSLTPAKIWSNLNEGGKAVKELVQLGVSVPVDFNQQKFKDVFKLAMQKPGVGKDGDLENNIRLALKQHGINDKKAATYLANQYKTERDNKMYSVVKNGVRLPSDPLTVLVIAQVNTLKDEDMAINLTRASSEAYVKTAMLYAAVQGLKLQNYTKYQGVTVNSKEIDAYKKYLNENKKSFGFHDLKEVKKSVIQEVKDQNKLMAKEPKYKFKI